MMRGENTWMYFYVQIQDVSSTFLEIHGCISMYVYKDVSSTCIEIQGCISMYGYRMYLVHSQKYRDVFLCTYYISKQLIIFI